MGTENELARGTNGMIRSRTVLRRTALVGVSGHSFSNLGPNRQVAYLTARAAREVKTADPAALESAQRKDRVEAVVSIGFRDVGEVHPVNAGYEGQRQ